MTDDQRHDIQILFDDRVKGLRDLDEYNLADIPDDELGPAIVLYHGTSAFVVLPERIGDDGVQLDIRAYLGGRQVSSLDLQVLPDD